MIGSSGGSLGTNPFHSVQHTFSADVTSATILVGDGGGDSDAWITVDLYDEFGGYVNSYNHFYATTVGPVSLGKEPMMNATKNRIQIDSRGQLVGKAGTGQQVSPSFPAQPIKIGQSWSASAPIEMPGQGPKKISATYTFKGIKTIAGKPLAELAIKTSGQASGTGTMLLFMSDGTLFRSTMNMNLQMTSPTGTTSNYKVTAEITRK